MNEQSSNPFRFSGPLSSDEMINRESESMELLSLARGHHASRLVAPRRYGKTTLFHRVLEEAHGNMVTALVDLEGVLAMGHIVVRIERAYSARLKGPIRRLVDRLFQTWNLGLSLDAAGFTARLQANPTIDTQSVLLRLLDLPREVFEKTGKRSFIVFDEIQDVLKVRGADGTIRSVIQHHQKAASYAFAGSAPGLMGRLFDDPSRPLLEQAVPISLKPLLISDFADYITKRFEATGKDAGSALGPLVEFGRGHPQRTMMLAHELWAITSFGGAADESTWIDARNSTLSALGSALSAAWEGFSANEQRVALALATSSDPLHSARTTAWVGLRLGSVDRALDQLKNKAELISTPDGPRLTDPILEFWLQSPTTSPAPTKQ